MPTIPQRTIRRAKDTGNGVVGKISAPQFKGGKQMGMTMEQAREMYKNSVRSKGFRFSGSTTTVTEKIDIPGDATMLVGMASLNGAWGSVTLKINQSDEIEDIDTGFTKIGDNKDFFRIDLPITGNDTIKLIITGYGAYTNQPFIFFFI